MIDIISHLPRIHAYLREFVFVVVAYVICHGMTALIVTPIQAVYLSDVTVFASLVYLPHGVRLLATWLLGARAILPLAVGAILSELLFRSTPEFEFLEPVLLKSTAVGALSAYFVFEVCKSFGFDFYAGKSKQTGWRWLLVVGALASVTNSVGQSLVHSGLIVPDDLLPVFATYALGDMIGVLVSMVGLMLIFRWMRILKDSEG